MRLALLSQACCLQRLVQTSAYEVSARARARAREPFGAKVRREGQQTIISLDCHAAAKPMVSSLRTVQHGGRTN